MKCCEGLCLSLDQGSRRSGAGPSVSGFVWCCISLVQPRSPMSLSTGGGTLGMTGEPLPAVR